MGYFTKTKFSTPSGARFSIMALNNPFCPTEVRIHADLPDDLTQAFDVVHGIEVMLTADIGKPPHDIALKVYRNRRNEYHIKGCGWYGGVIRKEGS